ncbi:MAG TPA: hypothetical protein VGV07_22425 [Devosia sp.]|jgi:hypothetical protein|nr:hypothetical protein [Devosia sp.]HEV2518024.1 hypothetical protein [Devosia sp.]
MNLIATIIIAVLIMIALSALTIGAFQAIGLSSPAAIIGALGL